MQQGNDILGTFAGEKEGNSVMLSDNGSRFITSNIATNTASRGSDIYEYSNQNGWTKFTQSVLRLRGNCFV
mgnify:CR=1 FL=1